MYAIFMSLAPAMTAWAVHLASLQLLFFISVARTAPGCDSNFFLQSPVSKLYDYQKEFEHNKAQATISYYHIYKKIFSYATYILWCRFKVLTSWVPFVQCTNQCVCFVSSFFIRDHSVYTCSGNEVVLAELPFSISVSS